MCNVLFRNGVPDDGINIKVDNNTSNRRACVIGAFLLVTLIYYDTKMITEPSFVSFTRLILAQYTKTRK